jgi:hypothetical protein
MFMHVLRPNKICRHMAHLLSCVGWTQS